MPRGYEKMRDSMVSEQGLSLQEAKRRAAATWNKHHPENPVGPGRHGKQSKRRKKRRKAKRGKGRKAEPDRKMY